MCLLKRRQTAESEPGRVESVAEPVQGQRLASGAFRAWRRVQGQRLEPPGRVEEQRAGPQPTEPEWVEEQRAEPQLTEPGRVDGRLEGPVEEPERRQSQREPQWRPPC